MIIKSLEIYGILIKGIIYLNYIGCHAKCSLKSYIACKIDVNSFLFLGFQMLVFVLDKPGFGLYRICKVDELMILVKEKNDDVIKVYESLMVCENIYEF